MAVVSSSSTTTLLMRRIAATRFASTESPVISSSLATAREFLPGKTRNAAALDLRMFKTRSSQSSSAVGFRQAKG